MTTQEAIDYGFNGMIQAITSVGVIISIILCFVIPPIGIIILIVNLITLSSAGKAKRRIEDKVSRRQ